MEKTLTWGQVDQAVNIVRADDAVKKARLEFEAADTLVSVERTDGKLKILIDIRNHVYEGSDEEVKDYFRRNMPEIDKMFEVTKP